MKFAGFLKTAKGKLALGLCAAAIVGVVVFLVFGNKSYRSISVKEAQGEVIVQGEINNGQAYPGERLYGGDDVSVKEASSLVMCMDNDKYMYADENTHFVLEADQSKDSSKIKIRLDKGSELNDLQSKLKSSDSYEVSTPNSTMSVRGTKFRVTVYEADELLYTLLEVTNGVVLAKLQTADGSFTGVEKEFTAGESALIRGNDAFSEFVTDENGETVRHLDYDSLPEDSVERLKALLEGEDEEKSGSTETSDTTEATVAEATTEETTSGVTTEAEETTQTEKKENTTEAKKTTEAVTTEEKTTTEATTEKKKETTTEAKKKETTTEAKKKETTTESTTEKVTTTEATTESTTAHTHNYSDWTVTKKATCTEDGTKERKCTVCGDVQTKSISAEGHDYGDWKKDPEPTCTDAGKKSRTCKTCGYVQSETIPALGHSYHLDQGGDEICGRCGKIKNAGDVN